MLTTVFKKQVQAQVHKIEISWSVEMSSKKKPIDNMHHVVFRIEEEDEHKTMPLTPQEKRNKPFYRKPALLPACVIMLSITSIMLLIMVIILLISLKYHSSCG